MHGNSLHIRLEPAEWDILNCNRRVLEQFQVRYLLQRGNQNVLITMAMNPPVVFDRFLTMR